LLQLALDILLTVLTPILLLVGIGALLRWKLRVDVATLSRLNIYLFVPGFVFHNVAHSTLKISEMAGVFGITVLQVATLGLLIWGIGRLLKVSRQTLAAIALAVMFYNSGNYGLPLAELAYPNSRSGERDAAAYQTFVMMAQNLLTFTVGMAIAASAHQGGIAKGFLTLIKLPILPGLLAGILAQWWIRSDPAHHHLPVWITGTTRYIKDGLVPIALVTLGAQLATNPRWPRWKPVGLVLILRLIFGPIQMMAMLWLLSKTGVPALNVWPWPAELLILTASVPTAVNTLLLTLELGGDAELAADCVFWTTVFSVVTITAWLIFLRGSIWLR
jgi:malate permease and related proteins